MPPPLGAISANGDAHIPCIDGARIAFGGHAKTKTRPGGATFLRQRDLVSGEETRVGEGCGARGRAELFPGTVMRGSAPQVVVACARPIVSAPFVESRKRGLTRAVAFPLIAIEI